MTAPSLNRSQPYSLIFGLGATGLSILRHLAPTTPRLVVVDTQPSPSLLAEAKALAPAAQFSLGTVDASIITNAQAIWLSPGVPRSLPALLAAASRGVPILGDIELFARSAPEARVLAITGSNGKSTTTSLVADLLAASGSRVAAGGNLSPPALDLLRGPVMDWYVLELSSFQLESTESLQPWAAAVLNISEDHLDRYASLTEYAATKARIYRQAERRVVNLDDERVKAMVTPGTPAISFSVNNPKADFCCIAGTDDEPWIMCAGERLLMVKSIKLQGRHNLANILAALALTWPLLTDLSAVCHCLQTFEGLPHRLTLVASVNGVDWFDDSKATNVGAAVAAILGLSPRPLILIAGGQAKGQDFRPLAEAVKACVKALVLLGVDAELVANACKGSVPIHHVEDMSEAVACAAELAISGDAVLLSPACASLDMFANYAARGRAFSAAVQARLAA